MCHPLEVQLALELIISPAWLTVCAFWLPSTNPFAWAHAATQPFWTLWLAGCLSISDDRHFKLSKLFLSKQDPHLGGDTVEEAEARKKHAEERRQEAVQQAALDQERGLEMRWPYISPRGKVQKDWRHTMKAHEHSVLFLILVQSCAEIPTAASILWRSHACRQAAAETQTVIRRWQRCEQAIWRHVKRLLSHMQDAVGLDWCISVVVEDGQEIMQWTGVQT